MKAFAALLDRLVLTPSRNGKLRLLVDYFRATPDPDRGYGLAAITGELTIANVKPAMLRSLMAERIDEVLFKLSYDYVGDLAETIALVWESGSAQQMRTEGEPGGRSGSSLSTPFAIAPPTRTLLAQASTSPGGGDKEAHHSKPLQSQTPGLTGESLSLSHIIDTLNTLGKLDAMTQIAGWLDQLDSSARYALLKLVTGGMRIGVSARLAKQALAELGRVDVSEIEELWHGLEPPYATLFAWLDGRAEKPEQLADAPFRPVMLAHALTKGDREKLDPKDFAAEWKWDGIRVQVTCENGIRRLYSRTGDDISPAFPDLIEAMDFEGAIDGELLIGRPCANGLLEIGSFGDLQQRLNRKTVSKKLLASHPVIVRAYDLLVQGEENLRDLPFVKRRKRLENFIPYLKPSRFDLSPIVDFNSWDDLAQHRENLPHPVIEGVMIKRWVAPYLAGRPKGHWFKWKRDPMIIDAVLMYAQRGHGKRSGYYSDYTFGVWNEGALVPVGKAYFGFTDDELKLIDKFVRDNTVDRFGPVRSVKAGANFGLVLEVAFEGLNRSSRHKSGVAMRFPRISRLRWDKPPSEADNLASLEALLS